MLPCPPHVKLAHDGLKLEFEICKPHGDLSQARGCPPKHRRRGLSVGNFEASIVRTSTSSVKSCDAPRVRATSAVVDLLLLTRCEFSGPISPRSSSRLWRSSCACWPRPVWTPRGAAFHPRPLAAQTPRQFVENILVRRLHAREVHEGYNFRFGHKPKATYRTWWSSATSLALK